LTYIKLYEFKLNSYLDHKCRSLQKLSAHVTTILRTYLVAQCLYSYCWISLAIPQTEIGDKIRGKIGQK